MSTVRPVAPCVKVAPTRSSHLMTDQQFSTWCASQWNPETESVQVASGTHQVLPSSVESKSDKNDPTNTLDGWQDATPYEPTIPEKYEHTGISIGLTGGNCSVRDAFPDDLASDRFDGERGFCRGLIQGRKLHAEQIGFGVGLEGRVCERPESIHRRFDRQFAAGWEAGAEEWRHRESVQARWLELEQSDRRWDAIDRHIDDRIALARVHESELAEVGWPNDGGQGGFR